MTLTAEKSAELLPTENLSRGRRRRAVKAYDPDIWATPARKSRNNSISNIENSVPGGSDRVTPSPKTPKSALKSHPKEPKSELRRGRGSNKEESDKSSAR